MERNSWRGRCLPSGAKSGKLLKPAALAGTRNQQIYISDHRIRLMKNRTQNLPLRKMLPVVVAAAIGIAGCSGEQAGDTNAGMAGGLAGGGVSALSLIHI